MPQDQPSEIPQNLLERLHLVPDRPLNYLPRPDELKDLKKLVLAEQNSSVVIAGKHQPASPRIGVHGMGGIGKSVLAVAVVREPEVLEAFPDGIFWVTIGQTPQMKLIQSELAFALSGTPFTFETEHQGKMRLGELLRTRHCLLVLDDVWESQHAGFLNELGTHSRMLVTTRNAEITKSLGAQLWRLDVLDDVQALNLLANWAKEEPHALPTEAAAIAKLCGNLPLALSLAGALVNDGLDWGDVLAALNCADVDFLDAEKIPLALKVSVDKLPELERTAYLKLAVFPEDVPLPEATLMTFWKQAFGLPDHRCRALIPKLEQRALLQRSETGGKRWIELHDLQHVYLKKLVSNLQPLHAELVQAYWNTCPGDWHTGPNDGYFFERLPSHLTQAGLNEELRNLLFDYRWMEAKLRYLGVSALMADYQTTSDVEVRLIYQTLQLSSHILNKDTTQLRSQLWGRLVGFSSPDIQALLNQTRETSQETWLRPNFSCLTPPGGPLLFTLEGHQLFVNAVAVFSDGNRVVSGSWDGTLKIWDLEARAELATLTGHTSGVTAVAVLPDGRRLVSASWDKTLKVWEVATGEELATFTKHTYPVTAVAVLPDGRRLVSVCWDQTLKVWDVETGTELATLIGHTSEVNAVTVFPDGHRLVSASKDHTLKVWDLAAGAELATLTGHTKQVTAVAVLPDGRRLVSASEDKTLKVWDVATGAELATFTGHTNIVTAVAVLPDGRRLVSASRDKTLKVWDAATVAELVTLTGHTNIVTAVAVLPDGCRLVSASDDQTLKVWEVGTGAELATLKRHTKAVMAVAVLPDGRRLVSASFDQTVKVWDVETGTELATLIGHTSEVNAVTVFPDGHRLVSASKDHTLKVWDLKTGVELATLTGHTSYVMAVAVLPDGRRLVSASWDETLKVWDVETGAELNTLTGHINAVIAVAVFLDGRRVVSASDDKTLKVWEADTGAELVTLTGHTRGVVAVAVLPDGRRLVSASRDQMLKVWDVETGAELATLTGHTEGVSKVVVVPGGRRLVSASRDHTLKLWDVETQQVLLTYFGDAPFSACDVAPDGKTIFAGDNLGRIHFLKLEEGSTQPLITNKPNKFFLPAILKEEKPMSLDPLNKQRLQDVEKLLAKQYKKLFEFQKAAGSTSSVKEKFDLEEQIEDEIKPTVKKYEKEYGEIIARLDFVTVLTEAEAETSVTEISQAVTALQVKPENTELVNMVKEIHEKLHAPKQTATAKLKVTIPIIPKLIEYVLEADTESGLMTAWNAIRARISKKAQLNP